MKRRTLIFFSLVMAILTLASCGKTPPDTENGKHTYATAWSYDDKSHWHACLDEGYTHLKADEAPHDDANEVVITPATDSAAGLGSYTCGVCGHKYEKIIPISVTIRTLPTVEETVYVGQPLSSVTLTGGDAGVAGSFSFTHPEETLKAEGSYSITFTPDDNNYASVTGEITLSAEQLTVTVSCGENGTANPTGTVNVNYGEDLRVVFAPNLGYAVDTLTLDGKTVAAASSYTLSDIKESHTLTASFKESELSLSITCLEGTENAYAVAGSTLTFTSLSADSVYAISGEIAGNIVIDVGEDYQFELELHGLTLYSHTDSPITILSGDKVTLVAKKDYENTITDLREEIPEDDETIHAAAIYSEVDLDIEGKGSLSVISENGNGIHTKDDLSVKNLTLSVTCKDNALKGNDSVTVEGGKLTLIAKAGDGIKTSNSSISEKGKQKGMISLTSCDLTIYAACDGIDAAYDAVIDGATTKLAIYTDKYSDYSEEVTATDANTYYIRFTSNAYQYAVKYYNSDSDYQWVTATYDSQVSGGMSRYYYYTFPKMPAYGQLQIFIYSSDQTPAQEEEYLVCTDYLSWNSAYDTFALTAYGNQLSYSWTNYTTTIQGGMGGPGGMGGGPGGMGGGPGGMNDGNTDKGDYSTKGIKAANEIRILAGEILIEAYDDAIHSGSDTSLENGSSPEGNVTVSGGVLTLSSNDDAIHADGALLVSGGNMTVTSAYEGLEGNTVTVSDGNIAITSTDDGINATGASGTTVTVSGGRLYINARGDGIDSNSTTSMGGILFSGGDVVTICQSSNNSAIDSERGYKYTGGRVLAISTSGGMSSEATNCQNFSSVATKKSVSLSNGAYLSVSVDGDTVVTVKLPVSMSASVVYLGDNGATFETSASSTATLDPSGVCWE